jgi:hypothetical protein
VFPLRTVACRRPLRRQHWRTAGCNARAVCRCQRLRSLELSRVWWPSASSTLWRPSARVPRCVAVLLAAVLRP